MNAETLLTAVKSDTIEIEVYGDGDHGVVTITDHGEGIAAE